VTGIASKRVDKQLAAQQLGVAIGEHSFVTSNDWSTTLFGNVTRHQPNISKSNRVAVIL